MSMSPDFRGMTIFHFCCPVCGSSPAEQRMDDFLASWDWRKQERLQDFISHVYTAIRQVRHGESRWRSKDFQRCADGLLERILNGREEAQFPATIHADGYGSTLNCLIACSLCQHGPGVRRPIAYFVRWNEACKVQTSNLCFEAALVLSGLLGKDHPPHSPDGIDLEQVGAALVRTAVSIGLQACPRCGRFTTTLYGPVQQFPSQGRCRWCLDEEGPVTITVSL